MNKKLKIIGGQKTKQKPIAKARGPGRPKGSYSLPESLTEKDLEVWISKLTKQGNKRTSSHDNHKREVQKSYELIQAAKKAGVPTSMIESSEGSSRQWISSMGKHSGR